MFDTDKELLSRIAAAFVLTWLSSFKVRMGSAAGVLHLGSAGSDLPY
jgi:hypothetical protein